MIYLKKSLHYYPFFEVIVTTKFCDLMMFIFLIIYWIFRWYLKSYYSMILIWCYYLVSNYLTSIQTMYTRTATSSQTIYTNAKQSLQNQKTKIIFQNWILLSPTRWIPIANFFEKNNRYHKPQLLPFKAKHVTMSIYKNMS